ncbi:MULTISPECIES: hypothetical protein [Streptomyces]|uniref:Uncharacterized protein n=1 Tax=Streptomyces sp. 900129855 TaxID=3155129 RepID=A0ABV2ZGP0_9ACTN
MDLHDELPSAVRAKELLALAEEHHARPARPLGVHEVAGHLVKAYALEAPGRTVSEPFAEEALRIAAGHLALGEQRGSLGLAVLIAHAGGDGDYVLLLTWIEGDMSDLAVFTGPVGQPQELRPGRAGLAPCVWEAAVFAHERDAFVRRILDGTGPLAERLTAWGADTVEGDVR